MGFDELVSGRGRCVSVGGRELAIFQIEGEVFAIDNGCPHRGGPLAEGDLAGCVVYCPLHAWSFDLRTGGSPSNPKIRVGSYPARLVAGWVEVELPDEDGFAGREAEPEMRSLRSADARPESIDSAPLAESS